MFFNVIDHLKRQIDRLFKGKADLVDGKVPEDQLPERPADTVTWDDVEGKPEEFPPAEHGHPDIAGSVEDLRTTKADATEVTALGARVGTAEAGIEGLRGSLGAMEQTVDEADMRSQNAYAQAMDAVGKAEAATLSAGNAYTTAMAADSKATDAVSKATDAVSKATDAKSIAEDAQVSADDAVGYAELAVRTAESKLDSDGTAADSAKLGGVAASGYALKTDVPKRVSNDTDTVRIDGEGNVYALEVPKSMYFIVDKGWGGGTDLQEWTLYSSGNGVWKWSNNGAYSSNSYYITYDASAGTLSAYYASGGYSRTITVEKNLDPTAEGVDFGGLGGLTVAQYSCSYVPKTNQRSEPSRPTDRLARESQVEEGLTPLAEGSLAGINDYLLNEAAVTEGRAVLSRDAVNRIDMTGVSEIELVYPESTGRVRDFVVVFENVSGTPAVDFGDPTFVSSDSSVLSVGEGTSVMSFTEISPDRFMVSRVSVTEV